MERWSGALDWTIGVPHPQISCVLSMRIMHYVVYAECDFADGVGLLNMCHLYNKQL